MATALSDAWTSANWQGQTHRGFWTKRRRSAMSLVAVMALVAGIALAYKLFEQEVPNNVVRDASNFDYVAEVHRAVGTGAAAWHPLGGDAGELPLFDGSENMFPGDTQTESVRIRNTHTPAHDASFFVYVDPASIYGYCTATTEVCTGPGNEVHPVDPNYRAWVDLWTLAIDKEKVLNVAGEEFNENDHAMPTTDTDAMSDHDQSSPIGTDAICNAKLIALTRAAPCNLGVIRGAGAVEMVGPNRQLQPLDTRWYTFAISELDTGTDQSRFKGLELRFKLIFQARVPAIADPGEPLIADGIPVTER